ncbi:Alpha/Beta hydrolase protein [Parachaetomium inaequale]|uniref:Alpha/Beta hydrolase protein n=1 Tax=Parachaetomium inaequale TaxID=2588326 RepID=A0AAN6PE80_9PEZI|nr:Alpha/Beta hydrolase protein [Parachaetomium inaequale]
MSINWAAIKPARIDGPLEPSGRDGFYAIHFRFRVPLVHSDPTHGEMIELHADLICGPGPPTKSTGNPTLFGILASLLPPYSTRPMTVYLCGGPGDGNPAFANPKLNWSILNMNTPILYVDYRGTGRSSPLKAASLAAMSPEKAAGLLTLFRQDSIAADLEAIRLCFNSVKFALVGQSFGGWIAMTYLSFLPDSLAGVWLAGGMPPMGKTPEEVYTALYKRMIRANEAYYARYPEDKARVMWVVSFLSLYDTGRGVVLPDGQRLTARGFLTLGRHFGRGEEGFKTVHALVAAFVEDAFVGCFSKATIGMFMEAGGTGFKLPRRPLYAALHEAIYCSGPGVASNWAAQRVGRRQAGGHFAWLDEDFRFDFPYPDKVEPLYFSGEMIHEFMLRNAGPELEPFIEPAKILAQYREWPALYNMETLSKNTAWLRALIYPEDLFVDFDLSKTTALRVGNCQQIWAPADWVHGSIKTRTQDAGINTILRTMAGRWSARDTK